jgi:hypothetical protein
MHVLLSVPIHCIFTFLALAQTVTHDPRIETLTVFFKAFRLFAVAAFILVFNFPNLIYTHIHI